MALRGILKATVYARIRPNQFLVRHVESGREVQARSGQPFSTQRLLVGEFVAAADCLSQAIKDLKVGVPYLSAPTVVMHPLEMTEGGLCAVERRVLLELAEGAGGKRGVIWEGRELVDNEILEKAYAA